MNNNKNTNNFERIIDVLFFVAIILAIMLFVFKDEINEELKNYEISKIEKPEDLNKSQVAKRDVVEPRKPKKDIKKPADNLNKKNNYFTKIPLSHFVSKVDNPNSMKINESGNLVLYGFGHSWSDYKYSLKNKENYKVSVTGRTSVSSSESSELIFGLSKNLKGWGQGGDAFTIRISPDPKNITQYSIWVRTKMYKEFIWTGSYTSDKAWQEITAIISANKLILFANEELIEKIDITGKIPLEGHFGITNYRDLKTEIKSVNILLMTAE